MTENRNLTGKNIVITGATSGIGRAALEALALRGAHVIGVGRSTARGDAVRQALLACDPHADVVFFTTDLSSQRRVRELAVNIYREVNASGHGKLDALINNAGTVSSWYTATEDGYELQFAVNHLAPFLLTHKLMPLLRRAQFGRVITVSSGSHYHTKMHWPDVMYRTNYNTLAAYKQSKLANVLFTAELNRRLGLGSNVRAYAADPGLVNTEIGLKGTGGIEALVWQVRKRAGVSPEQGAQTIVYLAADPKPACSHCIYWKDCQPIAPSDAALDAREAARLWALSEQLCGFAWLRKEQAA